MINIHHDGHIHTRLCHHASGDMEEYVLAAIRKGLQGICFLEHMEAGINYFETTWLTEADFDYYFSEGERLQKLYRDKITIGLGVEVGYSPAYKHELLTRLAARKWDMIGISYHFYQPPGTEVHLNLVSRKKENTQAFDRLRTEAVLQHYLDTLIEAVVTLPGTVLCHLDAALRYRKQHLFNHKHFLSIAKLFDEMKKKNMSLEINTSGIAMRKEPFPTREIVEMARTRSIPLVAGSDAHTPEDVGRFFSKLHQFI